MLTSVLELIFHVFLGCSLVAQWCLATTDDTCDADTCHPSSVVSVATNISSTVRLNDGVVMPLYGLGVAGLATGPNSETEQAVKIALKHGYRLIDTADWYGNEAEVGRAVRDSGLPREEVFVVSKVWHTNHGYANAKRALDQSLERLNLGYFDLFLIHAPIGGQLVQTYKALLKGKEQGKIRSVGVSNFGIAHFEGLKAAGLPAPSVNQIELHVWQHKKKLVDYCRANNIAIMGYRSLTFGQRITDPVIEEMAAKYKKTAAQFLLRWSVQMGYITIPKTGKESRILENMDVFDWKIDDHDIKRIENFEQWSNSWNPTEDPWEG